MQKIIRTYKYKLKQTTKQEETINSWIGACRVVYNLALETKIEAYKKGVNLSCYDLIKQLPQLRSEIDWIEDTPAESLQNTIERLDTAYKKFFKGGGFPKWAKKGKYNSLTFKQNIVLLEANVFRLPKLGKVRVFKDRMPTGKIKTATIIKEANGYFLSLTFEAETQNLYPTNENQVVGIDVGITYFLADSNGIFIENIRTTQKYAAKLRVLNRSLSRKKKYSNSWYKQKSILSRLHSKIARVRKDFLHKLSLEYVKNNSIIVVEDLKVQNMIRNKKLSKSIADVAWSMFFNMCSYKSKLYEKNFVKVKPNFTSQTCNKCGCVDKANRLSQSKFKCIECGHEENADFNAAQNIEELGIKINKTAA